MTAVFYYDRLLIKPANIGESLNQNVSFFNHGDHGNPPGIEIKILPFRLNGRIGQENTVIHYKNLKDCDRRFK